MSGLQRLCRMLAGLLLVGVMVGCDRRPEAGPPPPPVVTIAQPVQREVLEWDEYQGRLEAVAKAEVRARVSGFIEAAPMPEGVNVDKDVVLFTLDKRPFQAEVDRLAAEVDRALVQKNDAADELRRTEQAGTAAGDKERADARFALEAAIATHRASEASLRAAALNLEWTDIKAPIAGRTSNKKVTRGNLITGGAQGTPLTTIESIDPIYCYVDADEAAILKYQKLSRENKRATARETRVPAYLALSNESEFKHEGYIDFVDNRLDPGTGTLLARAVFKNDPEKFTPGLFARIVVPGSATYEAVLVADEAIASDQGRRYVLVVGADGVATDRTVTVRTLFGGMRVVEGVRPDEWVVVNGLLRVRPGMKVDAKRGPMPSRPGPRAFPDIPKDWNPLGPATMPSTAPSSAPTTMPVTSPTEPVSMLGSECEAFGADAAEPCSTHACSFAPSGLVNPVRQYPGLTPWAMRLSPLRGWLEPVHPTPLTSTDKAVGRVPFGIATAEVGR